MLQEQVGPFQELLHRAATDEQFRSRFKADPKEVMREAGIATPEGMEFQVVESTPELCYFVLPPQNAELAEDELEAVAGGTLRLYPGNIWSPINFYPGSIWRSPEI